MKGEKMDTGKKKISGNGEVTRRGFMAAAGAAALSFTIIKPELVRGTDANSKIKLGMIGCGGRGTWITDLFVEHGGYEIVAAADYFQDRVDKFGEKFNVPKNNRYINLSCYRKVLEQKVDAIAIESPPYFHTEQAAAGVDAGVHVYLAKPIAVDVPGCHQISRLGKKATLKKRCFLVDFQTRANEFFIEAVKRVHNGDIGELVFGEASYHCGRLGKQAEPGTAEARLKNWVFDKALSGDIITEQNIHTLDVASWVMDEEPLFAFGTGGRKVRTDVGDCRDYFTVLFQYSKNVGITFSSRQFNGHGSREGIRNRMFGTKGVLETEYGGKVFIRGKKFYKGGDTSEIYPEGASNNIATFYEDVTNGKYDNPTVRPSVRSNLVTILGRTAAYENRQVRWDEIVKSDERMVPDLSGLKA
ncbi:MAG: Gfo/Idh/MocA family protein [Planctomycetota bacterium]|jgi:predicted dehydrogenase